MVDISEILKVVIEQEASDLHLAVGVPPVVRIDGHLVKLDYPVLRANEARELIYSILSQDQRQKLETDWEVDFSYALYGMARFRVNAYFQRGTLSAAFRLIPAAIKTIDDLHLPKVLHTFCNKPRGSCWSPALPVPGSRPPSLPSSTRSTRCGAITSSPSRTPSNSFIATRSVW